MTIEQAKRFYCHDEDIKGADRCSNQCAGCKEWFPPVPPWWVDEGYQECRHIPGRGLCGLQRMAFTVGLFYNLSNNPFFSAYDGRYCYPSWNEASKALAAWDGTTDPPDEHWIKHKGHTEFSNPKNDQYDSSYSN